MPYVKIEMVKGRSEDEKAAVARAVTDALVTHAGARPESVWVIFQDVAREDWASGGALMSRR